MSGLDPSTVTKPSHDRWLIPTSCAICFIDLQASGKNEDWRWISISLLSTHAGEWQGRWRTRLRNCWQILRGGGRDFLEVTTEEELMTLIDALQIARHHAFDPPQETHG